MLKRNSSDFFKKNGYSVLKLLSSNDINSLKIDLLNKINYDSSNNAKLLNINNLQNFHKFNFSNKDFRNILDNSRRFINLNKGIIKKVNSKKIDNFLKDIWGHSDKKIVWVGNPKLNEIKFNCAGYRIFPPSKNKDKKSISLDEYHIDSYNNDPKSFITIWIPICGLSEKFTMDIIPKSHLIDHKNKNLFVENRKYISRNIKNNYTTKFKSLRPRLKFGEVFIHNPFLFHKGGKNLGNFSRISLEIRIFNKKYFNIKKTFNKKFYN